MQLRWWDIDRAVERLGDYWQQSSAIDSVYGIPTGGCFVAMLAAQRLDLPMLDEPQLRSLVLDDLIDSGDTMRPYAEAGYHTDALFHKPHSPHVLTPTSVEVTGWIKFPWEHDAAPLDAVVRLLQFCEHPPENLREEATKILAALVRPSGREKFLAMRDLQG